MGEHSDFGVGFEGEALERLCVDTIRTLSMDAVQKANSGHPGMPMGCAAMAHVLFTRFLKFDPADPKWPDRDRFVLSAGHGSMLLYSLLHLAGYDLSLDDIKAFRQFGSRTPGHPEFGHTPGVECTTGPLGQGISNAVGMAIAETWLAAKFNDGAPPEIPTKLPIFDHFTYVICSDGDLQEGVAAEACSLAGHLALGKLIVLYDDNGISIEGHTDLSYSDDVPKRFEAYGWHAQKIDGLDREAVAAAIEAARRETDRPSIICARTVIGHGSPNKADSHDAHGSPLGEDEIKLTKKAIGWPEDAKFLVPDAVRAVYAAAAARGAAARAEWTARRDVALAADPAKAALWEACWSGRLPADAAEALPKPEPGKSVATRKSGGDALAGLMEKIPNLIGGSADLAPSTNTFVKKWGSYSKTNRGGRNFHFGIREHAMGAILNGMCCHGGVRPFGATFFVFSDYMRPAMRLAALSRLNPIYVFTHDSIFVGEDGPTHEPVEHLAAARAIHGLTVIRPCDAVEANDAWCVAVNRNHDPVALVLSRQNLPTLERAPGSAYGTSRGAYHLAGEGDVTIIASGSEVALALAVREELLKDFGVASRVVSMPSWELFREQNEDYREETLGGPLRVAIEAGIQMGWDEWIGERGLFVGMYGYGASAPAGRLAEEFGFTPAQIVLNDIAPWLEGMRVEAKG